MIFDSFWDRLGVVFGVVLGSKIDPKSLLELNLNRLVFDLAIGWSQDGRQERLKRAQDPPRATQEPPVVRLPPPTRVDVAHGSF